MLDIEELMLEQPLGSRKTAPLNHAVRIKAFIGMQQEKSPQHGGRRQLSLFRKIFEISAGH
uniref:hypothetical protein n=1 Tax=Candidatus Electronema sp. TaxID=2698783 RepID=UPI004056254B